MKKLTHLMVALVCAVGLTASAADKTKRKELSAEARSLMKDIRAKYDKDGDKKLSADEIAKVSDEDKAKLKEAGLEGLLKPAKKKKDK